MGLVHRLHPIVHVTEGAVAPASAAGKGHSAAPRAARPRVTDARLALFGRVSLSSRPIQAVRSVIEQLAVRIGPMIGDAIFVRKVVLMVASAFAGRCWAMSATEFPRRPRTRGPDPG